ncbi:unannotated protein [freshwater metagenome]|uniref:Unannotated protein n=1 Tax=freshwater metagenome TaxID=449393 RepID=A0A6J7ENZ6_9ZZZZ
MVARGLSGVVMVALVATVVYLWPVAYGGNSGIVFVAGESMLPTYTSNDVVLTRKQDSYAVGDVIVYTIAAGDVGAGHQIIHRIVGGDGVSGWVTKGDNRKYPDSWHPINSQVLGRVAHSAAIGGTLRSIFVLLLAPWVWALAAMAVTFWIAWTFLAARDAEAEDVSTADAAVIIGVDMIPEVAGGGNDGIDPGRCPYAGTARCATCTTRFEDRRCA